MGIFASRFLHPLRQCAGPPTARLLSTGTAHLPHLLTAYIAHSAVCPLPCFTGDGTLLVERREREAEAEAWLPRAMALNGSS